MDRAYLSSTLVRECDKNPGSSRHAFVLDWQAQTIRGPNEVELPYSQKAPSMSRSRPVRADRCAIAGPRVRTGAV